MPLPAARRVVPFTALFLLALFAARPLEAQRREGPGTLRPTDSAHVAQLRTRQGDRLSGRIVAVDDDTVRILTRGGTLSLARAEVSEWRELPAGAVRPDGRVWHPNPNATRLLFAPTARTLRRGEGYVANKYLFVIDGAGGVTDDVTIGGGITILPSEDPSDNVVMALAKVGLVQTEQVQVAVGGLAARAGFDGGGTFGILFGVLSTGGEDSNLSLGVGYGFVDDAMADSPAIMLGGQLRVAERLSLITENYVMPDVDHPLFSYGIRLFGEKVSVDFAFINTPDSGIPLGLPFLGAALKF